MKINVLGNYKKSGYSSGRIIDKNGIAPTFTENHGSVLVITVNDEGLSYDEIKRQIDDFIKRWRANYGK